MNHHTNRLLSQERFALVLDYRASLKIVDRQSLKEIHYGKTFQRFYFHYTQQTCMMKVSNLLEAFCKKGALRNFAKFTGKHLCRPQTATLLKKRLWHRYFPVTFAKFLRTPFLTEHTPPVAASGFLPLSIFGKKLQQCLQNS